ncbi:hypothetical protein, partial [Shumkonia mesophila]|uniref:hypothetical protein n=1 Tax=Shumkonia mesophila TaxID=2838854 RepID=UPI0029345F1E
MNAATASRDTESRSSPSSDRPSRWQRLALSDVRIGRKIGFGFATVLALTMGVSYLGWNGQQQISGQLERTDAAALLADGLQEIRQDEKNYQIAGDEKSFKDATAKIAQLKERAGSIGQLFDSGADREWIASVEAQIATYEAALTHYRDLEVKKRAALDRMLQKSNDMETTSAELRSEQNTQFGDLAKGQAEIEEKRDAKLNLSDEATKITGQLAELLIEMQRFQIHRDEKRMVTFDTAATMVSFGLKNLQSLLGPENATMLPDSFIEIVDVIREDYKKLATDLLQGNTGQTAAAADNLEKKMRAIKSVLDGLAMSQRLDWQGLADDAKLAKIRMQKKQGITLLASSLIENVNKKRTAQLQYLRTPTAAAADAVRDGVGKIVGQLEELESTLSTDAEKAKAAAIHAGAAAYLEEFEGVVGTFAQQAAANREMAGAAQAVDGEIRRAEATQKTAMVAQQERSALLSVTGSAV